jgi:seryl-tRNA synthetase
LAQHSAIYRPESIDDLGKKVEEHINESKSKEEENNKTIQDLKKQLDEVKQERVSERKELEKKIEELQNSSNKSAEDLKKIIAQEMANHVNKKITVTDMMKTSLEMVKEGATTGAELGSKIFPVVGTAAGILVGASLGTLGSFTGAAVYFINTLLGKN